MKKLNLLSRAEMKNVMGGVPPVCESDACWITIGNWPDGCQEGFKCAEVLCSDGQSTRNECVRDFVEIS